MTQFEEQSKEKGWKAGILLRGKKHAKDASGKDPPERPVVATTEEGESLRGERIARGGHDVRREK